MRPRSAAAWVGALGLALAAAGRPAGGAGPLRVSNAATPKAIIWRAAAAPNNPSTSIPFNPDLGPLGTQTQAQAQAILAAMFQTWTDVPTSVAAYTNAGSLPVDVNGSNYTTYLNAGSDGYNPIISDSDGAIHDVLFGANNTVLGFAGFVSYFPTTARISEGQAALNGRWIDGNAANGELSSLNVFKGTILHEFGHYSGLDHTQINNREAFDGVASNDAAVPTMYPVNVFQGEATDRLVLNADDIQGISSLYPTASYSAQYGKITGTVYSSGAALQGVNVIARRVDDPRVEASSCVSGYLFRRKVNGVDDPNYGTSSIAYRGTFEISGLQPGYYTLEAEPIDQRFKDGSGVGPVTPPIMGGLREYWNGYLENTTYTYDNPTEFTVIPIVAAGTVSGIEIYMQLPTGVYESMSGAFDLNNSQIVYTPDWDAKQGYRARVLTGVTSFPIDPATHTVVSPTNNGYATVTSALGLYLPFFGSTYTAFNICANGIITFGSPGVGEVDSSPSAAELYSGNPKIAPLWYDLNPDVAAGGAGRISYQLFTTGLCVTFENVRTNASAAQVVNFQVFLEEATGIVTVTYLSCNPVGTKYLGVTSGGSGSGTEAVSRDFSALGNDSVPPVVTIATPAHRDVVSGTAVNFSAGAVDPAPSSGAPSLSFFIDGLRLASDVTSYTWNTTNYANGEHRLEVVGIDPAGNSSRVGIIVNVQNGGGVKIRQRVFDYVRSGDTVNCKLQILNEGSSSINDVRLDQFYLEVTGSFSGTRRVFCNPATGGVLPRVLASRIVGGGSVTITLVGHLPAGTNYIVRWVDNGFCDEAGNF